MAHIEEGGMSAEEETAASVRFEIAGQFNRLGFKDAEGDTLDWFSNHPGFINTYVYDVRKDTPNGYGGYEVTFDSSEKTARDIVTALKVMGIISEAQSDHHVPDYQQITKQHSFWDIIIPLDNINLEKLDMWQAGPRAAINPKHYMPS